MNFSQLSNQIFDNCIENYHLTDNVDAPIKNPYELRSIEFYLYLKNWIDTVEAVALLSVFHLQKE